jgi:hypothetical protein
VHLDGFVDFADIESVALTAVVTNAANGATVALRCTEQTGEDVTVEITALKVTTVAGP